MDIKNKLYTLHKKKFRIIFFIENNQIKKTIKINN